MVSAVWNKRSARLVVVADDEVDVAGARLLQRVGEPAETERAVGVRQRRRVAAAVRAAVVGRPRRRRRCPRERGGRCRSPDIASRGTAHDADTAQLPQSYSRTLSSVRHVRLRLRQRHRRLDRGDDAARPCRRSSRADRCRSGTRASRCSILNEIVSPRLTLMSVAKPWILRIARSVDVPFGRRIPRLAVLGDDPVRGPRALWRRVRRALCLGKGGQEDEEIRRAETGRGRQCKERGGCHESHGREGIIGRICVIPAGVSSRPLRSRRHARSWRWRPAAARRDRSAAAGSRRDRHVAEAAQAAHDRAA